MPSMDSDTLRRLLSGRLPGGRGKEKQGPAGGGGLHERKGSEVGEPVTCGQADRALVS